MKNASSLKFQNGADCRSNSTTSACSISTTTIEYDDTPPVVRLDCANNNNEPFLGQQNALYGRETELSLLQATLVASRTQSEIIILHGDEGTGKTTLGRSIRQLQQDHLYFLEGKFERTEKQQQPYQALGGALPDFILQLSATEKEVIRQSFNLGLSDRRILQSIVPPIHEILSTVGEKDCTNSSSNKHTIHDDIPRCPQFESSSMHRVLDAAANLLQALVSSSNDDVKPCLVLFLDDIQYASSLDIEFCFRLASKVSVPGIVFIYSYSNNSDIGDIPSSRAFGLNNKSVKYIEVKNLTKEQLATVVSKCLQSTTENTKPLLEILFQCTKGNFLQLFDALRIMRDEKLLEFINERWSWDCDKVQKYFCTVNDIFRHRSSLFDESTLENLRTLSCLGRKVSLELYQCLNSESFKVDVSRIIQIGWVKYDATRMQLCFTHDRFHRVTYESIADEDKYRYHHRLGRRLWRQVDMDKMPSYVMIIVDQLILAERLITEPKERYAVAKLCLWAGEHEVASTSSFHRARDYFVYGIQFLDPRSTWRDEYDLSLRLYNAVVECSYSSGSGADSVQKYVAEILGHAKNFNDTIRVRIVNLTILGSSGEALAATENGIGLLKLLGEKFPSHPSLFHVALSMFRLRRRLKGMTSDTILSLPVMNDPIKLAALQTINLTFPYAILTHPVLFLLLGLRIVSLALDNGISGLCPVGFAVLANILCALGLIEEGCRIGQLGIAIQGRYQNRYFLPRFYAAYYSAVHCWTRPFHECVQPLIHAYDVGLETGDIEFALTCALQSWLFRLAHVPLSDVDNGLFLISDQMNVMKQHMTYFVQRPVRQCLQNLMGLGTSDPWVLTGDIFSEDEMDHVKAVSYSLYAWMSFHRFLLRILFGKYDDTTLEIAKASRLGNWEHIDPHAYSFVLLMDGLLYVNRARACGRIWSRYARRCCTKLHRMALYEPRNYLGKQLMLDAELSSVCSSNHKETILKFVNAVAMTKESGSLVDCALTNELTARFLLRQGDVVAAATYLEESISFYRQWGAEAKVRFLQEEFAMLQFKR